MNDESSGSSPDDPGDPRRSSLRCASSMRLSGRTRSLPGRLPVSKPSRRTNSEPRASAVIPARLMARSEDFEILRILAVSKMSALEWSSWCPDDEVQRDVLPLVQSRVKDIDATKLKQRIERFELMVQRHLEGTEEIVEHKELMLNVFDSFVAPTVTPTGQKRNSAFVNEQDGSAIKRCCKSSCRSESVDMNRFLDQPEAAREIFTGPTSMKECTRKVKRCGFRGQLLCNAIDKLKVDLELREIFINLEDCQAIEYMLHFLRDKPI